MLVYLEIEESELETPVKEEEETTVRYMDEESLKGTLVSNNWSPL